ncbi:hypothetical protein D3C71_1838280 [compost metagenome]
MADSVHRDAPFLHTLDQIIQELPLLGRSGAVIVDDKGSSGSYIFFGIDECVINILRSENLIPLAVPESVRLAVVDDFVDYIPCIDDIIKVLHHILNVILQPCPQDVLVRLGVR